MKGNMAEPKEPPKTKLARALELKGRMATLFHEAHDETKAEVERLIDELNSLGHTYRLVDTPPEAKSATRGDGKTPTGIKRPRDPNAACTVCGFATDPQHDGRVHRSQGDNKKPFTDAELAEKGYKKR